LRFQAGNKRKITPLLIVLEFPILDYEDEDEDEDDLL